MSSRSQICCRAVAVGSRQLLWLWLLLLRLLLLWLLLLWLLLLWLLLLWLLLVRLLLAVVVPRKLHYGFADRSIGGRFGGFTELY